jgi:serine/threonine protein kinase
MSRWYRAPEIILQEPEYDFSSDNWSVGCILGELLKFSQVYSGHVPSNVKCVLFKGQSCFPLSPCDDMLNADDQSETIVSKNDQMIRILELIRTPDE